MSDLGQRQDTQGFYLDPLWAQLDPVATSYVIYCSLGLVWHSAVIRFLPFFLFVICFSHVCPDSPDSPEPVRGILTGVGICASSHLGLCLGVLGRFVMYRSKPV